MTMNAPQKLGRAMNSLGTDIGWNPATNDVANGRFSLVSGIENLLNALARRLSTPRGGLFYDPEYGFDLRQFVNADVDAALLQDIRQGVRTEILKDDRVSDCYVAVTYDAGATAIKVIVNVSTTSQSGRLIASIDRVSLSFLRQS